MKYYTMVSEFLSSKESEFLANDLLRFIEAFYLEETLAAHVAYFSDKTDNRQSFGFAVSGSDETNVLPCIPPSQIFAISRRLGFLNYRIYDLLGIDRETRCLLNVQVYSGNSKPVVPHYDGEYFDFEVKEDSSLHVKEGLRPEEVAVLTVLNESVGGGTRIHKPDGSSVVVEGQPGDLLRFNNRILLHSVDELTGDSSRNDGILRMIVGWRPLEDNVYEINDGQLGERLTSNQAKKKHYEFLHEKWPDVYDNHQKRNKAPAF